MKKLLFLMLAVMVGVGASAQSLPDVKIENQEGKVISTKSLADGTPMIISFWSTTCKPCIMELNAINDNLYDWLEEVDMKVVAVSVDDARTVSRARATKVKLFPKYKLGKSRKMRRAAAVVYIFTVGTFCDSMALSAEG